MGISKLIVEEILSEGRVGTARNMLNKRISHLAPSTQKVYERGLNRLINNDPSGNNKYLNWGVKRLVNGRLNTAKKQQELVDVIEKFHELQPYIKNKDINSYPDLHTIRFVIDDAQKKSEVKLKKEQEKGERDIVYEDDFWKVVVPYTHKASCKYGAGTQWCTTSKDNSGYYWEYMNEGILIYFLSKDKESDNEFYKFALRYDGYDWHRLSEGNSGYLTDCYLYDAKDGEHSAGPILKVLPRGKKIMEAIFNYAKTTNKEEKVNKYRPRFDASDVDEYEIAEEIMYDITLNENYLMGLIEDRGLSSTYPKVRVYADHNIEFDTYIDKMIINYDGDEYLDVMYDNNEADDIYLSKWDVVTNYVDSNFEEITSIRYDDTDKYNEYLAKASAHLMQYIVSELPARFVLGRIEQSIVDD